MLNLHQSILEQKLSLQKFEQLCYLWEKMAEIAGKEAILLTEHILTDGESINSINQAKPKFRLLALPGWNVLLSGKPNNNIVFYEATISFDNKIIDEFLEKLELKNVFKNRLLQLKQSRKTSNFQSQFILQLLGILTSQSDYLSTNYYAQNLDRILLNRIQQERIFDQVINQIEENIDLLAIVKMTIEHVRDLLKLDRLVVYQLKVETFSQTTGETELIDVVTYEAKADETIASILNFQGENCFSNNQELQNKYYEGFTLVINDLEKSDLPNCLYSLMKNLKVRAKIMTPIMVRDELWGFLIAHQCLTPRFWKQTDINFIVNIAQYLAIAIYQDQSYQELKTQKENLEKQVEKRAKELEYALLAAEVAHKSKKEFIGNISHELRTPLTCVIGLSKTLLLQFNQENNTFPIEQQQRYLKTIQDSGKKLLGLVNDLLEFSQIEAGKTSLNISNFSLHQIALSLINEFQEKANKHEVSLELDYLIDENNHEFYSDRDRLEQIAINLLDNAIKFTPAGGKVILRIWKEQNRVYFQIEDTGIGISDNNMPLLFEQFKQLEESKTRTHSGTGLGLALTKQLVELLRGKIEVESIIGKGSSFTFWLPSQTYPVCKVKDERQPPPKGSTIILISQEEEIANLICDLLTVAEYQVIWLIDESTAIKTIKLLEPSIVIVDNSLSKVNDICKKMKNLKIDKKLKLILMVDDLYPNTDVTQEIEEIEEIDDYLMKPLQPTSLIEKINNL